MKSSSSIRRRSLSLRGHKNLQAVSAGVKRLVAQLRGMTHLPPSSDVTTLERMEARGKRGGSVM